MFLPKTAAYLSAQKVLYTVLYTLLLILSEWIPENILKKTPGARRENSIPVVHHGRIYSTAALDFYLRLERRCTMSNMGSGSNPEPRRYDAATLYKSKHDYTSDMDQTIL